MASVRPLRRGEISLQRVAEHRRDGAATPSSRSSRHAAVGLPAQRYSASIAVGVVRQPARRTVLLPHRRRATATPCAHARRRSEPPPARSPTSGARRRGARSTAPRAPPVDQSPPRVMVSLLLTKANAADKAWAGSCTRAVRPAADRVRMGDSQPMPDLGAHHRDAQTSHGGRRADLYRALAQRTRELDERGRGVTHSYIAGLTSGKEQPSPRSLELIAGALDVTPDVFGEYRLATLRHQLDPKRSGFDAARRRCLELVG